MSVTCDISTECTQLLINRMHNFIWLLGDKSGTAYNVPDLGATMTPLDAMLQIWSFEYRIRKLKSFQIGQSVENFVVCRANACQVLFYGFL